MKSSPYVMLAVYCMSLKCGTPCHEHSTCHMHNHLHRDNTTLSCLCGELSMLTGTSCFNKKGMHNGQEQALALAGCKASETISQDALNVAGAGQHVTVLLNCVHQARPCANVTSHVHSSDQCMLSIQMQHGAWSQRRFNVFQ